MILYDVHNMPANDAHSRLAAIKKVILVLDDDDDILIDELLEILVEYESDDYFGTEGFEV